MTLVLAVTVAGATSCSAYKEYQDSQPANIQKVEARLVQAGFHKVPIETPAQNGAVAGLPLHQLNRYDSAKGSVFWYADPTVCKCLYQGDMLAYQSYQGIMEQERDTAEYMNDTQPNQVAYLGFFGDNFPPPLWYGTAWPVVLIGPPIFLAPGGIAGIGHPGGGGGIHFGGGPGGGIHRRR
jgi:hypothetical protein